MSATTGDPRPYPQATVHASEKYLPKPAVERDGIGLCLSGGGYRATLFHLGALLRLNELGILDRVKTISSVSGGSIMAAGLAAAIVKRAGPLGGLSRAEWEKDVSGPVREVTKKNIRTWPVLNRLLPWNWLRSATGVETLAATYEKELTPLRLAQLPITPRFVLCATDLSFGVNWTFTREDLGDWQAGYKAPPGDWPLGRAVAASSCFPPVFNPLPIGMEPSELKLGHAPQGPARDSCIKGLRLSDGGVYDNLGLEPVWKDHKTVLVSDGGALFNPEGDKNLLWRLKRYVSIQGNQDHALRIRWLISNFTSGLMTGTYWGVGGAGSNYGVPDWYSKSLARDVIAGIRTDLDAFSDAEAGVLENHGYLLADTAVKTHAATLLPPNPPPVRPPHPEWLPPRRVEAELREALKDSGKRNYLGRTYEPA
jgi:NTE family protein